MVKGTEVKMYRKSDDENDEVEYLGYEEYVSCSSDEDDDDTTPVIPYELTRVFLEKKRLEKKRKAPSSDSDDDGVEVLREYKRKQIFTYV